MTVTGPEAGARPVRLRKARLGGFIPAKHEVVTPWVRLVRAEDFLRGHCVGAELIGGALPDVARRGRRAARARLAPPGARPTASDYVRFWPDDVPLGPFLPARRGRAGRRDGGGDLPRRPRGGRDATSPTLA